MMPGEMSRKAARDYWDTHDIPEDAPEAEVTIKRGPTTVLSVRIDRDRLDRLRKLAVAEEIGVVTMARKLLSQAIDAAAAKNLRHYGDVGGGALTLTVENAAMILEASELIHDVVERLAAAARGDRPAESSADASHAVSWPVARPE